MLRLWHTELLQDSDEWYMKEVIIMKYEELMMEVVCFDSEDVVTASGGDTETGER